MDVELDSRHLHLMTVARSWCLFCALFFIRPCLGEALVVPMETLPGEGVWVSPWPKTLKKEAAFLRVRVWFEPQFLGDGEAYQRRAAEFDEVGRFALREAVTGALKAQSEESFAQAEAELKRFEKKGILRDLERHWIVNGFSCTMRSEEISALARVPGVRKVFLRPLRKRRWDKLPEPERSVPVIPALEKPALKKLPWYIKKLQADRVWKEFGVTGKGILNVIHDKNFIISDHLARSIYRNPKETPGNGIDDDGNGYIDDHFGYNFDRDSAVLYTASFSGDPKEKRVLHGTSCANIISGTGDERGNTQCGVAPLSQWAGVINLGGIERSIEWAIEQGADTYSMSFSRRNYGEYRSHWRKVMEHGSFCGVFFVSGAGNIARDEESPFLMNIPQSIPNAVFAAAGVQKDLSKTKFSCVGPVEWELEHYRDGVLQKPEVCAFNAKVDGQLPDGSMHKGLLNGNSYAGPMFCGAISLMLSADPDLLPWELKEIITDTATDVGPDGVDYETGHGLINCYQAVAEVLRRKALHSEG